MLTKLGSHVWVAFQNLKEDTRGVSALEYAILAGVIIVAVVAGVVMLGNSAEQLFDSANDAIQDAIGNTSSGGEG